MISMALRSLIYFLLRYPINVSTAMEFLASSFLGDQMKNYVSLNETLFSATDFICSHVLFTSKIISYHIIFLAQRRHIIPFNLFFNSINFIIFSLQIIVGLLHAPSSCLSCFSLFERSYLVLSKSIFILFSSLSDS